MADPCGRCGKVSHADRAKDMAEFLTEGPGDPRNPGSVAYAATAQVYASLAIAEERHQEVES